MKRVFYAVVATLPSESLAREYLEWLEDGHVDRVIQGGAHSAMIIRLERRPDDGFPAAAVQVMTQYVFATSMVFQKYEKESAPALRAEGKARFGSERGVVMTRMLGEIV